MLLAEWLGGPVLGAPFFHINASAILWRSLVRFRWSPHVFSLIGNIDFPCGLTQLEYEEGTFADFGLVGT